MNKYFFKNFLRKPSKGPNELRKLWTLEDIRITLQFILIVLLINLLIKGV